MIDTLKKIAFVGVGGMGQAAHLSNYILLEEECEVVACADLDFEKAKLVAQRNGIPRVYQDYGEMLEVEEVDGIVASQQFQIHHQYVPGLLSYGKPVFIEKPLASSVAAGELLQKEIEAHDGRVFIGYHKRSDLATVDAKSLIRQWSESGEKGKMTYIRVSMPPGDWMRGAWAHRRNVKNQIELEKLAVEDADAVHSDEYKQAYIQFVNFYIHQVNLIRFLGAQDYKVKYASENGRLLIAELDDGTSVCLEMATHHTSKDWDEKVEVYFEKAWLRLKLPAPMVQGYAGELVVFENESGRQSTATYTYAPEHAMLSQARNFLKFIDGGYDEATSIEDALKDLHIADQYLELVRGEEK